MLSLAASVENIFDPRIGRLTKLNLSGDDGNLKTNYSEFHDLDGQSFAKKVDVELTQPNSATMNVEVNHGRIKKSEEPIKFPFKIPSSYEKR